MATIWDLVNYTGFSVSAISGVLNNNPTMSVSDTTRKKIMEAASKLNYKTTDSKKQQSAPQRGRSYYPYGARKRLKI